MSAFAALVSAIGRPVADGPDEHERWRVYRDALVGPTGTELLRAALMDERDVVLLTSVVLAAMETEPLADLQEWLGLVPPTDRDIVKRRLEERMLLDRLLMNPRGDARGIDLWSDWVQRRVVERADDLETLGLLAERGRTRRVRSRARERLGNGGPRRDARPTGHGTNESHLG